MVESTYYFTIINKVTDVGLRLNVAQYLPDELELRMDNVSENEVGVFLKGKETYVNKFYERLQKTDLGHAKNYSFSKLEEVAEVGCFNVDTNRFFHKLECEQMGKFVDVGLSMNESMSTMDRNISSMRTDIQELKGSIMDLVSILTPK